MTAPYAADDRWSGESRGWRYYAQRVTGDGVPGEWLANDLPLRDVALTPVLSGPKRLTAVLDPAYRELVADDGQPLLQEWSTIVHAECDGALRGSALIESLADQGPRLSLTCGGLSGYAKNMAFSGDESFVDTDPLDLVRLMWANIQDDQDSDLGLEIDETTSDVRVGAVEERVEFTTDTGEDVSFSAGPYRLNSWDTTDIGGEVNELARDTPFDYREDDSWADHQRTQVRHRLRLGYPRLGERRNHRFVLGENVLQVPTVARPGGSYANHVRVLGAGEGPDQVMAEARVRDGRLRRMVTVERPDVTTTTRAKRVAREELARRRLTREITGLVVRDTPDVDLAGILPGDEVRFRGEMDWGSVDMWLRIVAVTYRPESPDVVELDVRHPGATS